jgi:putative ABC transport system permease protein
VLWNTLVMSLRAIRRNALRSFLTILGIVIGVAAVVALLTIGEGAKVQVTQDISALGKNLLTLRAGGFRRPGLSFVSAPPFYLNDVDAIVRDVRGVDYVVPSSSSRVLAVNGNVNWFTQLNGTTQQFLPCRGYSLDSGRMFSGAEEAGGNLVCVLGATVAQELFSGDDPLGQRIRAGRVSCLVIGVLAAKGQTAMGQDQDDLVLLPIRAFQRRVAGNDHVASIDLSVTDGYPTAMVKSSVESLMRERRSASSGLEDNFHVRDMQEIASLVKESTAALTALLSAIAAVSLLVGGIGIMNIMLVSVTERTREIGVRLAIGATSSEVMQQFLVEASVLSGLGGVIGLSLGLSGAAAATRGMGMPFLPSPLVALGAFVFSVLVGIIFGYLPARRAAGLNPIEALRHE